MMGNSRLVKNMAKADINLMKINTMKDKKILFRRWNYLSTYIGEFSQG